MGVNHFFGETILGNLSIRQDGSIVDHYLEQQIDPEPEIRREIAEEIIRRWAKWGGLTIHPTRDACENGCVTMSKGA